MSADKNEQVKEFLNYYVDQKNAPQYAVMINGVWGSGKTWFVNQFIEELLKKDRKCLYVSLYGLSDVGQIDSQFYRLLHPVLSSKGAAIAGKIAKAVARGTLKLDFGHHDEADVSAGIPDVNFQDLLKKGENCILIFDDLERCHIPIGEVLGYINYFVEHDGAKVILVGNEREIDEETEPDYVRIREKLIGRTLSIEGDFGSAIKSFLLEIESMPIRQHIAKHLDNIHLIFEMAEYRNLRHLRQALLDFARVFSLLEEDVQKNAELAIDFLTTLLIYTFEARAGELERAVLETLSVDPFVRYFRQSQQADNPMTVLENKYENYLPKQDIISGRMWAEIIFSGVVDKDGFRQAIRNSAYFPKQQAEWLRLWHSNNLDDEAYEAVLAEVTEKFNRGQFEDVGVVLQVAGMLISFVQRGISQDDKSRIVDQAKNNIDALKVAGKLVNDDATWDGKFDIEAKGLGFHGAELDEFKDIKRYIEKVVPEANQDTYPIKAGELMRLLEIDRTKFIQKLIVNNVENTYFNIPILTFIKPEEFCDVVFKASPDVQWTIQGVVEKRYEPHYRKVLEEEQPWLEKVAELMNIEAEKRRGKLSGERLLKVAEALKFTLEEWAKDQAAIRNG